MKKKWMRHLAYIAFTGGLLNSASLGAEPPGAIKLPPLLRAQTAGAEASVNAETGTIGISTAITASATATASISANSQASAGGIPARATASAIAQASSSGSDGADEESGNPGNGGEVDPDQNRQRAGKGAAGNSDADDRNAEPQCTAVAGSLATATVGNETDRDEQWLAIIDEDNCAANAKAKARAVERGRPE